MCFRSIDSSSQVWTHGYTRDLRNISANKIRILEIVFIVAKFLKKNLFLYKFPLFSPLPDPSPKRQLCYDCLFSISGIHPESVHPVANNANAAASAAVKDLQVREI